MWVVVKYVLVISFHQALIHHKYEYTEHVYINIT